MFQKMHNYLNDIDIVYALILMCLFIELVLRDLFYQEIGGCLLQLKAFCAIHHFVIAATTTNKNTPLEGIITWRNKGFPQIDNKKYCLQDMHYSMHCFLLHAFLTEHDFTIPVGNTNSHK